MSEECLEISTGYTPRYHQDLLHRSLKRFNVLVCHRRFGKTVFAINEMLDQALRCDLKSPQYAYIAPSYSQAKRVVWVMLKEIVGNIPGATFHEQELRADIPRPDREDNIRIMLLGAENPDSLRGIYLDGCVLDEYASMNPNIFGEVIRPALSDRKGWGIFVGTPAGANHFQEIYTKAKARPDWFTAIYKASETGIVDQDELDSARGEMSEEQYAQEFECSFTAALVGAYFGKQMELAEDEKRITSVPYDHNVPVATFWDLGVRDSTAIWFVQTVGKEIHLIDYVEESGQGLDHYVKILKDKEYIYSEHTLPHDGAARELGTGKSRQETLQRMGLRTWILPKWSIPDRIHAARTILNRCWFDAEKCQKGVTALKNYERKYDSKRSVFQDKPLHNWASNGADSFCYLGQGLREDSSRFGNRKDLPRFAENDYDVFDGG